jgi:hypothetical protein
LEAVNPDRLLPAALRQRTGRRLLMNIHAIRNAIDESLCAWREQREEKHKRHQIQWV